jgi:hypothetical protein
VQVLPISVITADVPTFYQLEGLQTVGLNLTRLLVGDPSAVEYPVRQKLTIPPRRGPRATILLRIDWLSCLIGALLW